MKNNLKIIKPVLNTAKKVNMEQSCNNVCYPGILKVGNIGC